MKVDPLDLAERVGWTFVQAFAGSVAAGGTAVTLDVFDWRAATTGAAVAALLALLKVFGVSLSLATTPTQLPAQAPTVDVGSPTYPSAPEDVSGRHQLDSSPATDPGGYAAPAADTSAAALAALSATPRVRLTP